MLSVIPVGSDEQTICLIMCILPEICNLFILVSLSTSFFTYASSVWKWNLRTWYLVASGILLVSCWACSPGWSCREKTSTIPTPSATCSPFCSAPQTDDVPAPSELVLLSRLIPGSGFNPLTCEGLLHLSSFCCFPGEADLNKHGCGMTGWTLPHQASHAACMGICATSFRCFLSVKWSIRSFPSWIIELLIFSLSIYIFILFYYLSVSSQTESF